MKYFESIMSGTQKLITEKNRKCVYSCVLLMYCALHLVMTLFHEPWYDEAEAWQIARCASIKDILFTIPHYEGHPPLWHLILAIPAKLNLPYELSLSLISLLFSALAVALFLKYAPFPEWVKVFVPFTYFAFYQYSVIARPYCMMMLAFVLMAITWQGRNTKPIEFVLSMAFLCLTSSYGIIIAGGISLVWLFGIIKEDGTKFLKDRRTHTLIGLLILAVLLMVEVMPYPDTSATAGKAVGDEVVKLPLKLLYVFLMMIPDTTLTRVLQSDTTGIEMSNMYMGAVPFACLIGILLWVIIVYQGSKKRTLAWFILPYTLFALFGALVYFGGHHIGIALLFFGFWSWITANGDYDHKSESNQTVEGIILHIMPFVTGLSLLISCFWSLSSFVLDVRYDYYPSRSSAEFIKKNDLQKYNIMTSWREDKDENGEITLTDTNSIGGVVALFPYFEHNIIYNAHKGEDALAYDTHKNASDAENEENLSLWRSKGYPYVLYNSPNLDTVFGDGSESDMPEYVLVYEKPYGMVWKGTVELYASTVYVREELREELGLPEVEKNLEYYIHMR